MGEQDYGQFEGMAESVLNGNWRSLNERTGVGAR